MITLGLGVEAERQGQPSEIELRVDLRWLFHRNCEEGARRAIDTAQLPKSRHRTGCSAIRCHGSNLRDVREPYREVYRRPIDKRRYHPNWPLCRD